MYLLTRQTVDNTASCVLQHLGVIDIALLIKAGTKFQQAQHVLASVGGIGQCRCYFTAVGKSVERYLDGDYLRVIRRLVQQIHKRVHALEGEGQQQVMLINIINIFALLQADIFGRLPLLVLIICTAADTAPEGQIKGDRRRKHTMLRYADLFHKDGL